jgi:endonuclease/exonuclease/phosphatase family metal-dependent hydrolase
MPALRTFSVATFNLYNLNLPDKPMYAGKPWTEAEYKKKLDFVSRQLDNIDADVVGLQELWHRDAMLEVLGQTALGAGYELLAPPDAKGRQIVCAALVRKGLLDGTPEWIKSFPEAMKLQSSGDDKQTPVIKVAISGFSRPVLRFALKLRDDHPPVQCFVCHLKSKLPTRIDQESWFDEAPDLYKPHRTALGAALSTIRRTAEATALRLMLTDVMKTSDTPVLVLGDINDGQHSNTSNILSEQPRYLVGDSQGGAGNALYTAQTLQEYRDTRDVYYTHVHQDLRESLDHILMSEQFYDHSRKRLWLFDGLAINNDHLNSEDHRQDGSGDHGVVKVSFKYKKAAAR